MRAFHLTCLAGIFCLINSTGVLAQLVVSSGTPVTTSPSTQIAFNNNLVINSSESDFSKATLILAGTDQTLDNRTGGSAITLGGVIVGVEGASTNGIKSIAGGSWEIAGTLVFNDGIIVPISATDGKIVHTIPSGSPGDILVNSSESYVGGIFYSRGLGTRFFPIGNSSGYFPAQLFNVTQGELEIGMEVVESNPSLTHGRDILGIFENRYWELIDPSQSLVGPLMALSTLQTTDFIEPTVGTILVGSAGRASGANSLGGSINGDYLVSSTGLSTTDRIFTLAKVNSDQVVVRIRNVVTPFVDNANDYLQIENIEIFPENRVILLDRWGGKVREWSNYTNVSGIANTAYDLSKIETGNYICIVEYKDGNSMRELSQMVTIINQ